MAVLTSLHRQRAASIHRGQAATLQVAANAAGDLSYEWFATDAKQVAWTAVAAAKAATLTISPDDTRFYYCVITSACGASVTSSSVVVEVTP